MNPPSFISRDEASIIAEIVADYEARTGRTLYPAQVERLMLNALAYRELLLRNQIQSAALQNLVDFSSAPVLDYLGVIVGVTRLAAQAATVTVRFTLTANVGGVTIPQGIRVSSVDGLAVFSTQAATVVPAGELVADVVCVAQVVGTSANGYAPGTLTNILDPQPYLALASNTATSGGGAALESDDSLRARIKLAPASFSNAGSSGAYKFFARSANAGIVDVAVVSPVRTGEVYLYPLMEDGSITPQSVLDAVLAACNGERVRPLSDLVFSVSPTRVTYSLTVNLTVYDTADPVSVQAEALANLQAFVTDKRRTLGQDITASQVIGQAQVDGVYSVALPGFSDLIISQTEFAFCNTVTVNISGTTNG